MTQVQKCPKITILSPDEKVSEFRGKILNHQRKTKKRLNSTKKNSPKNSKCSKPKKVTFLINSKRNCVIHVKFYRQQLTSDDLTCWHFKRRKKKIKSNSRSKRWKWRQCSLIAISTIPWLINRPVKKRDRMVVLNPARRNDCEIFLVFGRIFRQAKKSPMHDPKWPIWT